MRPFRIALAQTKVYPEKAMNIRCISESIVEAAKNGAKFIMFGETCNAPYNKKYLQEFAEDFTDSPTINTIKKAASDAGVYVAGSIPRKSQGKFYNTGFVVGPKGQMVAQMDKIHLFDIDIPGKITFKESDIVDRGNSLCLFDTQFCKMGMGICYDLRFPELALLMAKKGARVLLYPGNFNHTTGPLHWELLVRSRAVDTQCYTVAVSTAQSKQFPDLYQAWGHSVVADPMGRVLAGLDENAGIAYTDINPSMTDEVRKNIPVWTQRRDDIYELKEK